MEDFLGIRIENLGPHKFKLTQSGFTNKVLVTSKIEFFIRIDRDGELFEENWEYSIIVGILNYLPQTFRPDIAYTIHQYAKFTYSLFKYLHMVGIQIILRYL